MNGMTFVNTPGYYYSIAYFLAAILVNRTNKQRDGVKGYWRSSETGFISSRAKAAANAPASGR